MSLFSIWYRFDLYYIWLITKNNEIQKHIWYYDITSLIAYDINVTENVTNQALRSVKFPAKYFVYDWRIWLI